MLIDWILSVSLYQAQLLWINGHSTSIMFRKYFSFPVIPNLWLLHSFCPLFCDVPEPWGEALWYICFIYGWALHKHVFSVLCAVVNLCVNHLPLYMEAFLTRMESCSNLLSCCIMCLYGFNIFTWVAQSYNYGFLNSLCAFLLLFLSCYLSLVFYKPVSKELVWCKSDFSFLKNKISLFEEKRIYILSFQMEHLRHKMIFQVP